MPKLSAMAVALPWDIYQLLEAEIGREKATRLGKAIEVSLSAIEAKADEVAIQKKIELREELSKELASKGDLKIVETILRAELKEIEIRLNSRIDKLEIKLNFLIVLMIIALTLMNPVASDIIRSWIK